jgi:hypothetical protein
MEAHPENLRNLQKGTEGTHLNNRNIMVVQFPAIMAIGDSDSNFRDETARLWTKAVVWLDYEAPVPDGGTSQPENGGARGRYVEHLAPPRTANITEYGTLNGRVIVAKCRSSAFRAGCKTSLSALHSHKGYGIPSPRWEWDTLIEGGSDFKKRRTIF